MQPGDFLYAIAANTSASVDEIAAVNKLNPSVALIAGQVRALAQVPLPLHIYPTVARPRPALTPARACTRACIGPKKPS